MFKYVDSDKHNNILLTYFNIKEYNSSIIYHVKGGYIGLINNNVMILNLDSEHREYKYINKIFDKFVKTLTINVLYASTNQPSLLLELGFVNVKNKYVYYIKYHNVLTLEYPYSHHFLSLETIHNSLRDIKNYKMKTKKTNNVFPDIELNFQLERHMNRITDYFTDYCRSRCVFKSNKVPYDYYKLNKGNILLQSLTNNEFDLNKFENVLYNSPNVKFCNNFQVTLAAQIYKMFNATRIFDSSSGWGDRLLAAIALDLPYCGTDPSKCLKPLYKKIIKTLGDKTKHKIYNIGIEELNVNDVGTFDLCFTSPPFYDLEIYDNNNEGQSILSYKTELEWIQGFLVPLVEQNIKVLISKGHMALYIPDYPYIMKYLNNHPLLKYKGNINVYTPKRRKVFVWQKV